ncbi:hypothetical protein BB558_001898 [Smittium angustum]|uniref:AMP-dependent synthetase/ligase domain-containing protein n=1 Tax=Smittium angustum TaxID=133377 RepID=A0A2U1JA76_SMIAN|nr:hypothetical protein BB558_001898 [Smittium angustum]
MRYDAPGFKAYVVPNSAVEGYSPILKNLVYKDDASITEHSDKHTVYDIFWSSVKQVPERNFVGHRIYNSTNGTYGPFVFQTYAQVAERVTNFGAGIIQMRLNDVQSKEEKSSIAKRNWGVAVYSANRPEWNITDKALSSQSLFSVALYDTLGESSMEYILNHSECTVVVCSLDKVHKILKNVDTMPNLKAIISLDSIHTNVPVATGQLPPFVPSPFNTKATDVLKQWAASKSIGFYDILEIEALGKASGIPHHPPLPDDIYTLMYTSGTTGNPKGAVSTHKNYMTAARSGAMGRFNPDSGPVMISYLPLAHCYGKSAENVNMLLQGTIGYFCGDISMILEDCRELQPTGFPGIPRILARFYDTITAMTVNAPGLKGMIYRKAVEEKLANLYAGKGSKHEFWDKILFDRVRALLSSRLEGMGSGSASIEPHVLNFLRVTFCVDMGEGYGLTETASNGLRQAKGDITPGCIGFPAPGMQVRLGDVPEMKYFVTDSPYPRGEIYLKGPAVFKGYFKEKEKTDEVLSSDGWFATGDIARINEDGSVSIIDRKKSIFKLSQGEYLAPERMENTFSKHPLVMQSFVHGYSTKNYPVCVVVPDPVTFVPWATKILSDLGEDTGNGNYEYLTKNEKINKAFLAELADHGRKSKMQGYEIVRAVHLEHVPFDVETNRLLTPTFKLKRFDAMNYYKDIIDQLYQK